MNLVERVRRWWKPAEDCEDAHPLSDQERQEGQPLTMQDELAKLTRGSTIGGPPIDPEDELRSE